ncbi:MAG: hypothetical protein JWN15_2225, partial [Firmicutes bacterium]|nr:hypothetical protein [Bacillota bacterium]
MVKGGHCMGAVPSQYIVIQQAEWAGRKFYTAHDQRADQVVYLMQEPVRGRLSVPQHPSLPTLQPLLVADDAGWLVGTPPTGDTLEDLRNQGRLSEQDMLSMLLSVADALAELGAQQPPLVPAYLDPAGIKRDALSRWVLDYLLLAQAPEVRKATAPPPGIYAFGVLLYWLFTGQTARMTRVQVGKVEGVAPALQFIMIRCLGRSYPGLAELRADIERSGREKDFRGVVRLIAKQLPDAPGAAEKLLPAAQKLALEYRKVPLGGPQIPVDDRPWALPARPDDGFRKYVVPPPPDPPKQKLRRGAAFTLAGLAALALSG